jgi:hypothetical protein
MLLVDLGAADAVVARAPPRPRPHSHSQSLTRGVQEALLKGLQGKVPKGVAACVDLLLQALRRAAHALRRALLRVWRRG